MIDLYAIEARYRARFTAEDSAEESADDIPALLARVRELERDLACAETFQSMTEAAADRADKDVRLILTRLSSERDERERQHAARGAEAVAAIDALRAEIAELRGKRPDHRAGIPLPRLTIDPAHDRLVTGILVRAWTADGRCVNADISELDTTSLIAWLRRDGGENRLAENVVGILLGRGNIHTGGGE